MGEIWDKLRMVSNEFIETDDYIGYNEKVV